MWAKGRGLGGVLRLRLLGEVACLPHADHPEDSNERGLFTVVGSQGRTGRSHLPPLPLHGDEGLPSGCFLSWGGFDLTSLMREGGAGMCRPTWDPKTTYGKIRRKSRGRYLAFFRLFVFSGWSGGWYEYTAVPRGFTFINTGCGANLFHVLIIDLIFCVFFCCAQHGSARLGL